MRGKDSKKYCHNFADQDHPRLCGEKEASYTEMQEQDHPRLCGEKGFEKKTLNQSIGSPPPMRGKVL